MKTIENSTQSLIVGARKVLWACRALDFPQEYKHIHEDLINASKKVLLAQLPQSAEAQSVDPLWLCEIDDLMLSTRTRNCLRSECIKYVGELVPRSMNELYKTPGLGEGSFNEIKNTLGSRYLHLGTNLPCFINGWFRLEHDERWEKHLQELRARYA